MTQRVFSKSSFSDYVEATHSSDIQAKRGRVGGEKSKGGGRPKDKNSINEKKPWIDMNVSRRSYFYRKSKSHII